MSAPLQQYRSLLVIDDHNMIVNGIRLLVGHRFQDIWQANTGTGGLTLANRHQPQLVIVDYVLPDGTGDAIAKEIKYRHPATRILAYSFNGYSAAVLKMFGAGVHGYVIKSEDDEEFVRAVGTLLEGKEYFCREARNHIIHRVFPEEEHPRLIVANTGFSTKEIEIIRLICQQKNSQGDQQPGLPLRKDCRTIPQQYLQTHRRPEYRRYRPLCPAKSYHRSRGLVKHGRNSYLHRLSPN